MKKFVPVGSVGDFVKYQRIRKGLSQTDLGRKAGVSQAYVSFIENKRRVMVTTKTLRRILKVFGIKVRAGFMMWR